MAQSKLREETNAVLTTVSSSEKPHEAGSLATVVRRRRHIINQPGVMVEEELVASNSANSNQSSHVNQGNDPNQHPHGHPKHPPKKRVAIQGARKVWGTLRTATAAVVANAIDRLSSTKFDPKSLRVKRKFKTTQKGSVYGVMYLPYTCLIRNGPTLPTKRVGNLSKYTAMKIAFLHVPCLPSNHKHLLYQI